jgi:hypothetical protein
VYVGYLVLEATGSAAFPPYRQALVLGVAPVTGLCLAYVLFRAFRQGKNPA